MIGKPDSGKLNVRFDEGELEIEPLPLRQLSTLPTYTTYNIQSTPKRVLINQFSLSPSRRAG